MKHSDSIGKLAEALAKAQGEIKNALKDSANPYFKSKYADLAGIWDAARGPLSANGLALIQCPRCTETSVEVETILAHSSGEWISEVLALPAVQQSKEKGERFDAHTIGSAVTYAKRYALAAMVGVATEDDDGNAAADSMKDARRKAMDILLPAARKGRDQFGVAWKAISVAMRRSVTEEDMRTLEATVKVVENGNDSKKEAANA